MTSRLERRVAAHLRVVKNRRTGSANQGDRGKGSGPVSRAIERRLIAAERRLNPPVPEVSEIFIIRLIITPGGLPKSDDDPTFATAGEMRWERAPAETFAAFRERAVAAATAAGERRIVIGGLSGNGDA
jgi:hypothetical protein